MPDPLSASERDDIHALLSQKPEVAWAEVGRELGRHPTTIAREVDPNGGRDSYRPSSAQRRCDQERCRSRPVRLDESDPRRQRVLDELTAGRSPEAIWADLAAEGVEDAPCVETIYAAVYDGRLGLKPADVLRTRRRRRRGRQARRANKGPALPNIDARPTSVNDRSEAGHWEADQIIGAHNRSSMLWLTERVTRYGIGISMPDGYSAVAVLAGLVEACEQIPAHLLKSITFDQGSEWAQWELLCGTYEIDAWFCDPHSPWQRGQIENQNRAWRWWFPRGTDLASVTQTEINQATAIINGQRRRNLDYQSPASLYA
ncbi:MAG: IS30 family transposase, partial [Actinomycetia bacterium]|nr:IS30 family transposase [Actinomycetes bacterium]